ncbi:hypothetical protein AVEN_216121-1 [Araneus ventricosus]|uniref:Uncharacterized protein n=1 Tax=Araneus ventricosus TaxID=182803 RepID=A0A4Y2UFC9_ARAVE|nr:hypothetical protein AVEN_216121-1 [Araneus ventricosus]
MPTWPCGLRRLPIAPAYRIAGSNPRQELEVSSHSTPFKFLERLSTSANDRIGLVVKSWIRGQRIRGSKPDFTRVPPCVGLLDAKSNVLAKHPPAGQMRKFGEEVCSSGIVI